MQRIHLSGVSSDEPGNMPMKSFTLALLFLGVCSPCGLGDDIPEPARRNYPIVETGQTRFYNENREIAEPRPGQPFFGQDANSKGTQASYRDNGDGTISDLVTGLMWQKDPGRKMSLREAQRGAARCKLGGHTDWRLPSIKELYSLIQFSGIDPDPMGRRNLDLRPFIDTRYFKFEYGDSRRGERIIDSQYVSSTLYVGRTMRGEETVFGVNFADGRIKGYGVRDPRSRGDKQFYVLYVRGNPDYGHNQFRDQGNGTILDEATGLEWLKFDSGHFKAGPRGDGTLNWQEALDWAEGFEYAGHDDWRLPDAKELQSIVDYSRAPSVNGSAAIDPVFQISKVEIAGRSDHPYFWTSTTHVGQRQSNAAVYICFGGGWGWMSIPPHAPAQLMDVHGAGCQRSDPKDGDPSVFPRGRGPQGDVVRISNHVRLVRNP